MRYVAYCAVLFCSLVSGIHIAPASAEKRVALVIGNGSYTHIAHLPNVANDAAAMTALFKAAGFDAVDVRQNLGVSELRHALREFASRTTDADTAVIFYAGHGIEVGQVNYLVPVDARLIADIDVEDEAVPLDRVLQVMEPAKHLRLVILDACRENPFAKSMKRTVAGRSVGRGLGRIDPSTGDALIAFATKPNAIAEDGKGPNSPFTAALVKHLLTPGLDLRIALGRVRDEVRANTVSSQEPYVTGSLGGSIVSIAGPLTPTVSAPQQLAVAPPSMGPNDYCSGIETLVANETRCLMPGGTFKDCPDCPEMVVIPAGDFMMGSAADDKGRSPDGSEEPQRRVTIARPFAAGKYEVTFKEWDTCASGGRFACKHRPNDEGWGRGCVQL